MKSMKLGKKGSWDIVSFSLGTLVTLVQIGLFFLVINLFSTYTVGINIYQVFSSIDTYREMFHQQAQQTSMSALVFLTNKPFVQFMIFLGLVGLWLVNINWIDKKRSN